MLSKIQKFRQQNTAMQQAKKFYLIPVLHASFAGSKLHRKLTRYTLIWGTFYFFLLGGLSSCGSLPQSSLNVINPELGVKVTNIRDLKPQQNNGAIVHLTGKVAKQVPLLERRVYQLQDSTGTIWVLTNQTTPQPGDRVLIKTQVRYQSIPLAGKEFGEVYVEEQEQLDRIPAR